VQGGARLHHSPGSVPLAGAPCRFRGCRASYSTVERSGPVSGDQLAEEVGCLPVLTFDHVGVDSQGGRGSCVAETAGEGACVAPGGDQARVAEVPQAVESYLLDVLGNAESCEGLAERVGFHWLSARGVEGQDIALRVQRGRGLRADVSAPARCWVRTAMVNESNAMVRSWWVLGGPMTHPGPSSCLDHSTDMERRPLGVDFSPAESEQLATAHSGSRGYGDGCCEDGLTHLVGGGDELLNELRTGQLFGLGS
jgi:hypothetical protein